jgi:hypothetical protein
LHNRTPFIVSKSNTHLEIGDKEPFNKIIWISKSMHTEVKVFIYTNNQLLVILALLYRGKLNSKRHAQRKADKINTVVTEKNIQLLNAI